MESTGLFAKQKVIPCHPRNPMKKTVDGVHAIPITLF
jgi:hypothetical protein